MNASRMISTACKPGRVLAVSLLLPLLITPASPSTVGFRPPVDYPAGTAPRGIVVADFNGDRKMDLAVGDYGDPNVGDDGGVKLFLGKGDGTFQSATSNVVGKNPCLTPACLVSADFNGDGKVDLAVANNDSSLSLLFGRGDGTFQPHVDYVTSGRPSQLHLSDLNGDRHPDLIILVFDSSVSTRLGNSDGTFQDEVAYSTAFPPTGVSVFDANGDARPDMVITEGKHGIETLLGNGDGTFQTGISCTCGATLAMFNPTEGADFNEDGHMDLAVMLFDDHQLRSAEKVLLGNGDGTFTPVGTPLHTRLAGFVGAVADLSQDGHTDLAFTLDPLVALFGDGSGTFKLANFASERAATSIAAADINGDNFPDVIATNFNTGTISVLLNTKQPVAILSVSLSGNGSGTVSSIPPGINCIGNIATCSPPFNSAPFNIGAAVSLSSSASEGTAFAGWSGACSGTGACNLTMNADQSVTATFKFPDFSVSTDTTTALVTAGHTATSTINVTSVGGFNSVVQLTCSVDSATPRAPACSLNPASATLPADGSVNSILTITTTPPTIALALPSNSSGFDYAMWLPAVAFALVGLGQGHRERKRLLSYLFGALLFTGLLFQTSCGGGRSTDPGGSPGTPIGQYNITITATSGSTQHSTGVTIEVE
jgi:hypothetical protein